MKAESTIMSKHRQDKKDHIQKLATAIKLLIDAPKTVIERSRIIAIDLPRRPSAFGQPFRHML